jgi:hypothetical protein
MVARPEDQPRIDLEHSIATILSALECLDVAIVRLQQARQRQERIMRTENEWLVIQEITDAQAALRRCRRYLISLHPNRRPEFDERNHS